MSASLSPKSFVLHSHSLLGLHVYSAGAASRVCASTSLSTLPEVPPYSALQWTQAVFIAGLRGVPSCLHDKALRRLRGVRGQRPAVRSACCPPVTLNLMSNALLSLRTGLYPGLHPVRMNRLDPHTTRSHVCA